MAYFQRRKKGELKTIPLNAEAQRAIQEQLRKFREKFGRDAGPEDPIFFDPDANVSHFTGNLTKLRLLLIHLRLPQPCEFPLLPVKVNGLLYRLFLQLQLICSCNSCSVTPNRCAKVSLEILRSFSTLTWRRISLRIETLWAASIAASCLRVFEISTNETMM